MKKNCLISISLATCLTFIGTSAAAKCAADTDMKTYTDMVEVLNSNRSGLRTARNISRKAAKQKGAEKIQIQAYGRIDLISNRLEYWSKDTARYLKKYTNSHPDAVCERMDKDSAYMADFLLLGLVYKRSPMAAYQHLHGGLYK